MKPTPKHLAILAVVLVAALPALARGRDRGPGFGPPHDGGMIPMAHALDLTEEQRTTIREITRTYMDGDLGTRLDAVHEARMALGKLVHDPAATDDAIAQAAQAVGTAEAAAAVTRHRMAVEIDGVLTDEQRAKAAELRERMGNEPPFRPRGPRPDED